MSAIITLSLAVSTCVQTNVSKFAPFFEHTIEPIDFRLGDESEFEFSDVRFTVGDHDRIIVSYEKKAKKNGETVGYFFRYSENGGKDFGDEINESVIFPKKKTKLGVLFWFVDDGIAALFTIRENLFYSHSSNLKNWTKPVQINDERNSFRGGRAFVSKNETELYAAWMDKRIGFPLIFFSHSEDGGKTWSPNKAIDFDFQKGDQTVPQLILGKNGRILVFWEDHRDQKTLLDIRYSYSDDNGKTWSKSRKINDDNMPVWQKSFSVVNDGPNIFIAFGDFRDKGDFDDNDWNIYFSLSRDNGETWEDNRRINDNPPGKDGDPRLAIDKEKNLYCLWHTRRDTLFGQIVLSYSNDLGDTWSPSVPLTKQDEMIEAGTSFLLSSKNGGLYGTWTRETYQNLEPVAVSIDKTSIRLSDQKKNVSGEKPSSLPLGLKPDELVFSDDFSTRDASKWVSKNGVWTVVNGSYRGVQPKNERFPKPFISYAKFTEPDSYILRGRFKLDELSHDTAAIYFRSNESGLKHYVIKNRFRNGAWLSVKNNDLSIGLHRVGGNLLAQKRFPFKNGNWYEFRLLVLPDGIDYYIDNRLMLSHREKLVLPRGKFGVGGLVQAPTYFDDIALYKLENETS